MSKKVKGLAPPSIQANVGPSRKIISTPHTSRNNPTKSAFTSPSRPQNKSFPPPPRNKDISLHTPSVSSRDNSDGEKSPSPKTPMTNPRVGSGLVKAKKKRRSVRKWTKEEDEQMKILVQRFGTRKWSTIGGFLDGRNGKQCRERWHNQLDPNIKKCAWSEDEEVRKSSVSLSLFALVYFFYDAKSFARHVFFFFSSFFLFFLCSRSLVGCLTVYFFFCILVFAPPSPTFLCRFC